MCHLGRAYPAINLQMPTWLRVCPSDMIRLILLKRSIDHWLASVENLDAAIKYKLQPSLLCVGAFYADIQNLRGCRHQLLNQGQTFLLSRRRPCHGTDYPLAQNTGWAKHCSTGKGNKITVIYLHYGRLVLMFIMKLIDLEFSYQPSERFGRRIDQWRSHP